MRNRLRLAAILLVTLAAARGAGAEVLVRWDAADIPARESLGLLTVVVPIEREATVRNALLRGYDVYLELDAATALTLPPRAGRIAGVVVRDALSAADVARLQRRFEVRGQRVLALDHRAKWPHIRTNWVTKHNDVLQVTGRSAQPWIENNGALIRLAAAAGRSATHALTYEWKPITVADSSEGPGLDNYLVAIAEVGSFGGTLILPIHPRFQQRLLAGHPQARADWLEIRRALDFYSWNLTDRYEPIPNIAVVTAAPDRSFEVMNLLARHNLPFRPIEPARLTAAALAGLDLVIMADRPSPSQAQVLAEFAAAGGTVLLTAAEGDLPWRASPAAQKTAERASYAVGRGHVIEASAAITDPDAFALDMRQILGRDRRVVDIWNGITVLAAPYRQADSTTIMVVAINYAHQPMPIQLRVRGIYAAVYYEAPDQPATLLPRQHRDGFTEFLLPALRIGARVFLSE